MVPGANGNENRILSWDGVMEMEPSPMSIIRKATICPVRAYPPMDTYIISVSRG